MRKNLKIWHPELCNIHDNADIGDDIVIHSHVVIYDDVKIGNSVHIESGVFIPNGVTIEDKCFIGPHTVFTNDCRPPSQGKCWKKTLVMQGSSIGANCTILPGVIIGDNAMVGAGSVVTKNIPTGEVWLGNPAKFYKMRNDL